MIRAFLAIPVPEEITRMLTGIQVGLDFGRIVPPQNFHITLVYLGEHPEPVLEDLHTLLDGAGGQPIEIRIEGLGVFGSARPRSLFAEVAPNKDLGGLRKRVRNAARGAGIELEQGQYRPHVALARFGNGLVGEDAAKLQAFISARISRVHGNFEAEMFHLYESRLGSEAPTYTPLADYPLTG
ncbi:MAG: RNA 2',3'-cyclic phosphodiesterase [Pseudomonadota bacterium]